MGADVDYAMLVKLYEQEPEVEKRYNPAQYVGAEKHIIQSNPNVEAISAV